MPDDLTPENVRGLLQSDVYRLEGLLDPEDSSYPDLDDWHELTMSALDSMRTAIRLLEQIEREEAGNA
jgi:hypothetical protein